MATKKRYVKDKVVFNAAGLLTDKWKPFLLITDTSTKVLDYNKICIMSFGTVISHINNKRLWTAIIIEEEVIRKTKPKVVPKTPSNIGSCKIKLSDIYDDVKDNS